MMMILVKQPGPPQRPRLPPVQPPHAVAPAPASRQPPRTSPASPRAAAAFGAGLRCRRRRRRRGRGRSAPRVCASLAGGGLGGGRGGSPAPRRRGRGLLPSPPAFLSGSGLQGRLRQEGRTWWRDWSFTSYLVDFPVHFSPRQHASFAGRKPNGPGIPKPFQMLSLEEPFTFQEKNVTLFEYVLSFFTCKNMQVEAFQEIRKTLQRMNSDFFFLTPLPVFPGKRNTDLQNSFLILQGTWSFVRYLLLWSLSSRL